MSWPLCSLGEVATIERRGVDPIEIPVGTRYVGLENIAAGREITGWQVVGDVEVSSTKFHFDAGHLLYGKLRPNLGKIARPDFSGVCSTDILPVRPGPRLDRSYLRHYLAQPSMIDFAASRATGANLPRLSPRVLETFEIPLPPLHEQRRIAAILDQADALCAKEHRAIASVEGLIGSIFQQIFGTQLANAERVALKSLTSVITKGTTPTSVGLSFAESGVPFLRVQNLADGTVKFGPGDLYIDRIAHSKLARSKVQPGDVLISIAGTIGRSAVVPDGAPEMNCNQAVAIVRLSDSSFGRWLMTWLATHDAIRQIKASSVTATISNLSLSQIGALEVPRPETSDLAAFNDRAAAVDAQRLRHQTALAGLACLKDSLVARAFNGSL